MPRSVLHLLLILLIATTLTPFTTAQSELEARVVRQVQEAYQAGGVTFSSLYNSDRFSAEERAYLGRLYEILFALPGYLLQEERSVGRIPSRREIAAGFGVGEPSIRLLLTVIEQDSRIPPLFTRDSEGEITRLNHDHIAAFASRRGDGVRFTQWEGRTAPVFELMDFDGRNFASEQLKGKPVLLYFWFTGCPPCVRIAPILSELHQTFRDRIGFVGLNADDLLEIGTTRKSRKGYAEQQGLRFVQLELDIETRAAFGNVNIFPTLFVIDGEGVVRRHLINFQPRETLESALGEVVH